MQELIFMNPLRIVAPTLLLAVCLLPPSAIGQKLVTRLTLAEPQSAV
jgi:hypothetical protein